MKNSFMLLLFGAMVIASCQSEPKVSQANGVAQSTTTTSTPIKTIKPNFNRGPDARAWSILTADLWHYNFALSVTDTPTDNIYEGYWLNFEDDFSYEKGYYDQVIAKGEYDYNNDTKILEMIPTEGDDEPSQWSIKTNGEVIIMIGTSKYGNNATQIKIVREKERPIKRN